MRAALAVLILLVLPGLAAAEELTPAGAATMVSDGDARPTIAMQDSFIKAFTITVGAGGKAGYVRLRVLRWANGGQKAMQTSERVLLPAEPGPHRFTTNLHYSWNNGDTVALDQETGEHAILAVKQGLHFDVWAPPLADGETRAYSSRTEDRELQITTEKVADPADKCCTPPPLDPPQQPPPPPRADPPADEPGLALECRRRHSGRLIRLTVKGRGKVKVLTRIRTTTLRRTVKVDGSRAIRVRVPKRLFGKRRAVDAMVVVTAPGERPMRRDIVVTR